MMPPSLSLSEPARNHPICGFPDALRERRSGILPHHSFSPTKFQKPRMFVMSRLRSLLSICLPFAFASALFAQSNIASQLVPDTKQPIDQSYTEKIKQYTTEPYFNSPLTSYLPASK